MYYIYKLFFSLAWAKELAVMWTCVVVTPTTSQWTMFPSIILYCTLIVFFCTNVLISFETFQFISCWRQGPLAWAGRSKGGKSSTWWRRPVEVAKDFLLSLDVFPSLPMNIEDVHFQKRLNFQMEQRCEERSQRCSGKVQSCLQSAARKSCCFQSTARKSCCFQSATTKSRKPGTSEFFT